MKIFYALIFSLLYILRVQSDLKSEKCNLIKTISIGHGSEFFGGHWYSWFRNWQHGFECTQFTVANVAFYNNVLKLNGNFRFQKVTSQSSLYDVTFAIWDPTKLGEQFRDIDEPYPYNFDRYLPKVPANPLATNSLPIEFFMPQTDFNFTVYTRNNLKGLGRWTLCLANGALESSYRATYDMNLTILSCPRVFTPAPTTQPTPSYVFPGDFVWGKTSNETDFLNGNFLNSNYSINFNVSFYDSLLNEPSIEVSVNSTNDDLDNITESNNSSDLYSNLTAINKFEDCPSNSSALETNKYIFKYNEMIAGNFSNSSYSYNYLCKVGYKYSSINFDKTISNLCLGVLFPTSNSFLLFENDFQIYQDYYNNSLSSANCLKKIDFNSSEDVGDSSYNNNSSGIYLNHELNKRFGFALVSQCDNFNSAGVIIFENFNSTFFTFHTNNTDNYAYLRIGFKLPQIETIETITQPPTMYPSAAPHYTASWKKDEPYFKYFVNFPEIEIPSKICQGNLVLSHDDDPPNNLVCISNKSQKSTSFFNITSSFLYKHLNMTNISYWHSSTFSCNPKYINQKDSKLLKIKSDMYIESFAYSINFLSLDGVDCINNDCSHDEAHFFIKGSLVGFNQKVSIIPIQNNSIVDANFLSQTCANKTDSNSFLHFIKDKSCGDLNLSIQHNFGWNVLNITSLLHCQKIFNQNNISFMIISDDKSNFMNKNFSTLTEWFTGNTEPQNSPFIALYRSKS